MCSKWMQKYRDSSLYVKISTIIWVLAFLITGSIVLTFTLYYNYMVKERTIAGIRSATRNAVNTINMNYTNILERFVATCGTEDFTSDLRNLTDPQLSYTAKEGLVQDELAVLVNCNYMVNSALILSADKETYYSLYKSPLRTSLLPLVEPQELETLQGITWLGERKSPFRSTVNVFPIVFPVTITNFTYTGISDTSQWPPDAYVIIMLDTARLAQSLAISSETASSGTFLFLTQEGTVLNAGVTQEIQQFLDEADTAEFLRRFPDTSREGALFTKSGYYLIASRLENSGLTLLYCLEQENLSSIFGRAGLLILVVLSVIVLILLVISFLTARYITRPVNTLVRVVGEIGSGTYREHITFSTNDEMGELCRAVNSMHETIEQQMVQIKEEEARKYMAEIKLLAEQINPHFLYNTLEYIQLEVIGGQADAASNMIQYLAEYLRIGLSYGDDLITVSNELKHVHSYIKIMNQRFRQSISFLYTAEPGLEQHYILKTILQPLVENSIKHGFSIDSSGIPVSAPTIEINFYRKENRLHIEIIDNGTGFDVKKAEKILYFDSTPGNGRHVGLHNIYYRLATYYGKDAVSFSLESIPYYRNCILIRLPLEHGGRLTASAAELTLQKGTL